MSGGWVDGWSEWVLTTHGFEFVFSNFHNGYSNLTIDTKISL